MRNKILCLSFVLFLMIGNAVKAQNPMLKNGLTVKPLLMDFKTPLGDKLYGFDNLDDTGWGAEIAYFRNINQYLNFGFPLRFGGVKIPISDNTLTDRRIVGSLDGILQLGLFKESNVIKPYVFSGIGAMVDETEGMNPLVPVGLGMNVRFHPNIYLQAQTEYRKVFTDNRDNLVHSLGLLFLLDPSDKNKKPTDGDGDGIADVDDECPLLAGPAMTKGCPDKDGDFVIDSKDKCPDVAGLVKFSGCPDTDGDGVGDQDDDCPEAVGPIDNKGCPFADADGDGVLDKDDDCPNEAGLASNKGCPNMDRDGDGVSNDLDNCPDAFGPASNNGCPFADADNDGVEDKNDRCPNAAGPASNNGCPEISNEDKELLNFAVQNLEFETSRATLKSSSLDILNKIADVMNRYPNYSLSIGGHTDSVGSAQKNQLLSENRAKACYEYLTTKGVAPSRMSYVGYGETQPIADNRYKDGRKKNRRVEFNVFLK